MGKLQPETRVCMELLAYAEAGEQCVEKVVGIGLAHNLADEGSC